MAYLADNPPRRSQFRRPRRLPPSGVIAVHTAENTPDYVAFDGGAEAVARFIRSRPDAGSYHDLVDSDSAINLVDYGDEAFHDGTGTNPHSLGLSIATRADVWPFAPQRWRDGAIEQAAQAAARMAAWVKAETGKTIPARRITADEARRLLPGFVTHAQLDPRRRTDPGDGFPWDQFLKRFTELTAPPVAPIPPEDDMPYQLLEVTDGSAKGQVWMVTPAGPVHVVSPAQLDIFRASGIASKSKPARVGSHQITTWLANIAGKRNA